MKNLLLLLCLLFTFAISNAQDDPFSRLKRTAAKEAPEKSELSPVKIQRTNPNWERINKAPIPFKPFELKDKNGKSISPNMPVTLRNGKTITAKEYIEKLNEVEKKLNSEGQSIRNKTTAVVSKTVTNNQMLSRQTAAFPKSIAPLKSESKVKEYMSPYKKIGNLTLKPYDEYTKGEKELLASYSFAKSIDAGVTAKKLTRVKKVKPGLNMVNFSPKSLHKTDITNTKKWTLGNPETFEVGIEGKLHRFAIIYPFNEAHLDKSMSEFKVSGSGRIWGSVLSHSIDLLNCSGEFYAPADTSKKMSAKISIKAAGITLYNFSKEYQQTASFSNFYGKEFDKSFPIDVPIGLGFDFKGKIGVKGRAGFEYGGTLYRTFASVQGKPIAEIDGYAEAGLELLDVIGFGVGGRLTFLKGSLSLDAFTGIWAQDAEQIVLAISYNFGYDIEMLSGALYCFIELCAPDWVPFVGGDCTRPVEHEFFNWAGIRKTGTIAEGTETFVLANLWIPDNNQPGLMIR